MQKSIKQLLAEVILELGLPDDNDTPILKVWAKEGMGEIGNSRLQGKETDWMLVSDLAVTKPKDMIAPLKVMLSIDKKHCITPQISEKIIRCGCCENTRSQCEVTMGETNAEFYFSSNALKYNACKIIYIGTPVDEDGEPLIEDDAKRAVKQYISYMMLNRKRRQDRSAIPQSEIDSEYHKWVVLKNQAAGRINMPHLIEMDSIISQYYNAGITIDMFVDRWDQYWGGYYV